MLNIHCPKFVNLMKSIYNVFHFDCLLFFFSVSPIVSNEHFSIFSPIFAPTTKYIWAAISRLEQIRYLPTANLLLFLFFTAMPNRYSKSIIFFFVQWQTKCQSAKMNIFLFLLLNETMFAIFLTKNLIVCDYLHSFTLNNVLPSEMNSLIFLRKAVSDGSRLVHYAHYAHMYTMLDT